MITTRVFFLTFLTVLTGCTTVTIDEHRQADTFINAGDSVVVLGRRHASDYETEPSLISCIAENLSSGKNGIDVIPEPQFVNEFYPWFEPRTAPMKVKDLKRLLRKEEVANRLEAYNIRYIIWVDGNTETTHSAGSIGCTIGTGGAGCFGFGTWEKQSGYEATIWDYHNQTSVGRISTDASGTSYMPAVVVPIPLIARVQHNACKGMAAQLKGFLKPDPNT